MSIELPIDNMFGYRTVEPEDAQRIGLPCVTHGLVLVTVADGSEWTLATADMEFFASLVSASVGDAEFLEVILRTGGPTWRLVFGWPAPNIGFNPEPRIPPTTDWS